MYHINVLIIITIIEKDRGIVTSNNLNLLNLFQIYL